MEYENFTFGEAMEALADRAGVELPKQEYTSAQRQEADKRARLLEINKEAAKYFYMLLRGERGARALSYFRKRELSVMTFPAIVHATQSPVSGALALVVGIAAAWFGASL